MRIKLFFFVILCAGFLAPTDNSPASAPPAPALDEPSVQVVPVPLLGQVPQAIVDRTGAIHLVFVAGEDVYYARSTNGGAFFTAPLRVNSEPGSSHPPNMYRGPDIALGQHGRVHVIWYGNAWQRKLPPGQSGAHYAFLDPAAGRFSNTVNLNHLPSDNYSLAADQQGNVAVFWMAGGLFLSFSADNGATFAPARKVDLADTCECCASRAFLRADGLLVCAYRDKTANNRDMFLASTRLPNFEWRKTRISGAPWHIEGCPMTGSSLVPAGSDLLAAWETKGNISYSRLRQAEHFQGNEIVATVKGGKWPVALSDPRGRVVLSWKRGNDLQWQAYDRNDQSLGGVRTAPGSNPFRHTGVVKADGSFLLFQ
jgi:hypothetical protein